jgi:Zn-dependent protease
LLIGEPPPTQADLKFSIFGIPVRVHPFFWLIALVFGASYDSDPVTILIGVAVIFVSILVHELGHAFMFRSFGGRPWITLYGMGGLASCQTRPRSMLGNIMISFAGPAAGFLLAASVLAAIKLSGREIFFHLSFEPFSNGPLFENSNLHIAISFLLFVNVLWGLVNLLPIYPLDGGQISRELLLGVSARRGFVWSLGLSMICATAVAGYGLMQREIYLAILFGYLAYTSGATMQAYQRYGGQ